jgi:hypothetical protein
VQRRSFVKVKEMNLKSKLSNFKRKNFIFSKLVLLVPGISVERKAKTPLFSIFLRITGRGLYPTGTYIQYIHTVVIKSKNQKKLERHQ